MMEKVPITRYGYHRLLRELVYLRRVIRPQVLEALQEARSYGVKLSNQDYLLARERQVVLQRKIQDLEDRLAQCEVVVGRRFLLKEVGFGTSISIQNIDTARSIST
jgi:transcription elongation factor GreA